MARPIPKSELLKDLAEASGQSKAACDAFLTALGDVVTARAVKGETVKLPGIVTIEVRERPEREIRNPATGEMMTKAADRAPGFKATRELKEALNT